MRCTHGCDPSVSSGTEASLFCWTLPATEGQQCLATLGGLWDVAWDTWHVAMKRDPSALAMVAAELPPRKKEGITMDHDKSTADVRCRLAMHVEHRGTMVPGVTWGPLDGTRGTRGTRGLTVLPESS